MLDFWNLIVESNTFNFVVLVVIIVMVWQKANFSAKLDQIRLDIIDSMEKAKNEKVKAEKSLYSAQNEVKNLDKEIEHELEEAKKRTKNVVESIENTIRENMDKIEKNITTVIENETRKLNNTLLNDTIDRAITRSEEILKNKFRENPSLHEEYINRSIKQLQKVKM